jgi:hypothetical protein
MHTWSRETCDADASTKHVARRIVTSATLLARIPSTKDTLLYVEAVSKSTPLTKEASEHCAGAGASNTL